LYADGADFQPRPHFDPGGKAPAVQCDGHTRITGSSVPVVLRQRTTAVGYKRKFNSSNYLP
jgi:hypothetical protein